MSLDIQYLIIGIAVGVSLTLAVQAIWRAFRHGKSPGCSSCRSTSCPLKNRGR